MTQTLALNGPFCGLLAVPRSTGKSETAVELERLQEAVRKHLLKSYSLKDKAERALIELAEVQDEASLPDWDGYGAKPVDRWSCLQAMRFIQALPTTVPVPEISADPDGDVALDWAFGPRRALSVSIGPSGRCSFAWMRGQSTFRGTQWINDGIPQNIVNALAELARDVDVVTAATW